MHRKDYVLIAKVLKSAKNQAIVQGIFSEEMVKKITDLFCISLKEENYSFNETKFRDYINE